MKGPSGMCSPPAHIHSKGIRHITTIGFNTGSCLEDQNRKTKNKANSVSDGTVNGTELMSLMNMAPNGSSNPYIYREQRRKLHKNLYVHRHPRLWTAPDQSGRDGERSKRTMEGDAITEADPDNDTAYSSQRFKPLSGHGDEREALFYFPLRAL